MESSLNIAYLELQSDVGVFFGYGAGSLVNPTNPDTVWTTQQLAQIDKAVKSGLRRFYYPEALPGEKESYNWSFLQPIATIQIPAGGNFTIAKGIQISQTPLPEDFGGFEGRISIVQTGPGTSAPWYLELTNDGRLLELYSYSPQRTGRPEVAAETALKGTGPQAASRSALIIYPLPDTNYTLQARYYINPDYLSGTLPYAYGGPQHAETLREACLSAAESYLDDNPNGSHRQEFQRRLAASVAMDRRHKPQTLGFNRDLSDAMPDWYGREYWLANGITYLGVQH